MVDKKGYLFRSGDLFFSDRIRAFLETFIYGSYNGTFYLTYWSILHLISGIFIAYIFKNYYTIKNPYWIGFWIHNLWEIWQILIGMSKPFKLTGQNNIVDTILDTLLFMLGMWIVLDSDIPA